MKSQPNALRLTLVNSLCPELDYSEAEIQRLIQVLDRDGSFDPPVGELSIAFVDQEEIARLHDQFMGDPTPTDVITFPGDPELELAGEICVCPQVARDYALKQGQEFSPELALYLIHGYLHLCGFDDIEESDRAQMRQAEQQALQIVRTAAALPSFRFA